jgi:hypothetical protein
VKGWLDSRLAEMAGLRLDVSIVRLEQRVKRLERAYSPGTLALAAGGLTAATVQGFGHAAIAGWIMVVANIASIALTFGVRR